MAIIRYVPLMGLVLLLYNIFAVAHIENPGFSWNNKFDTMYLPSGGEVSLTYSEGFIIFAIVILFIEIIKSTSISDHAITEQVLSVLIFIGFLVQFLNSKHAAEPTFLILTIISLVEVLAGFTILIKVAKRDINFGGG